MSQITISTLHTAGSDLFSDSESYLKELSEEDLDIQGGIWPILAMEISGSIVTVGSAFVGVGIGVAASYAYTKYKTTID
ncbi:MAG: hypothetical protein KME21_14465 [Desmonostoc vinosum HA7617-LM4]|jgi:hypothetical protein|nr:hypothetical protein [Desmonostoc vinosum HA7617-LM4]